MKVPDDLLIRIKTYIADAALGEYGYVDTTGKAIIDDIEKLPVLTDKPKVWVVLNDIAYCGPEIWAVYDSEIKADLEIQRVKKSRSLYKSNRKDLIVEPWDIE